MTATQKSRTVSLFTQLFSRRAAGVALAIILPVCLSGCLMQQGTRQVIRTQEGDKYCYQTLANVDCYQDAQPFSSARLTAEPTWRPAPPLPASPAAALPPIPAGAAAPAMPVERQPVTIPEVKPAAKSTKPAKTSAPIKLGP